MGKQTSVETRELVLKFKQEGKSLREIAKLIKRSHNIVKKIVDKFKNFKQLENRPHSGKTKPLSGTEIRSVVGEERINPAASAVKISQNIEKTSGVPVSPSTIRRALHDNGLNGRVPRKKPFISKTNQKRRLLFAHKYKSRDISFWKNVLFSDESKFEVFGSKKSTKIWRRKNQEFFEENIVPTVKHGGGSIMVWGCMAATGVGNLVFVESTMNKTDYLNILRDNLTPSVAKLSLDKAWVFQHDNDPKHTAKIVKEWLLYRTPQQLDHPPHSPDLNPIEHLWEYLDRQIRKRVISSKESLKSILLGERQKIPTEMTAGLVESMPRRLETILKSKGKQTKY